MARVFSLDTAHQVHHHKPQLYWWQVPALWCLCDLRIGKATGGRGCLEGNTGNTAKSISNSWLDGFDRFKKGFGPSLISFLPNSTWTFFGCNETISVCNAKAK